MEFALFYPDAEAWIPALSTTCAEKGRETDIVFGSKIGSIAGTASSSRRGCRGTVDRTLG